MSQVLLVRSLYLSELGLERHDQTVGQDCDPVFHTFPITHYDLPLVEVDVLDAQLEALAEAQSGPIEQARHEQSGPLEAPQQLLGVDGNYVYSCGHNGDLYCIDINTHKPVWKANIWTDFGGKPASGTSSGFRSREPGSFPIWAIMQCPLVCGDLLIAASQAPEAGVVAYDKLTGEVKLEKTANLGNESYASPSVVKIDDTDQVVMVISSTNPFGNSGLPRTLGNAVGIDPATGKVLWEYDKWNCHISVPSAVDAGENRVLVVGGYELGATMIKVQKKEEGKYRATD